MTTALWFYFTLIVVIVNGVVSNENVSSVGDDVATYEEVKDIVNHPEKYLIDVRSYELVERDGLIPGSVIIPYTELEKALDMSYDDFKKAYGREKPSQDATLIFSCLDGDYAKMASELAKEKGWHSAKPYMGSWKEWAQKEGLH